MNYLRDINRIPNVMVELQKTWEMVPDWRLGQFWCNLQRTCGNDLFYKEDEDLVKVLKALREFWENGNE